MGEWAMHSIVRLGRGETEGKGVPWCLDGEVASSFTCCAGEVGFFAV